MNECMGFCKYMHFGELTNK